MERRHLLPLCLLCLCAGAAAGSMAADTAAVAGKVVDRDGKPLGGARVYLTIENRNPPGLRQVRSAADGSYRFPALRQGELPGMVIAAKQGYGVWGVLLVDNADHSGVEVRLPPAAPIAGKVLDADGKPIAGAAVRVEQASWGPGGHAPLPERFPLLSTTTDRTGSFRLPLVGEGSNCGLRVHHPRYAKYFQWVQSPRTEAVAIRLELAAAITGRVLYEGTRAPAAGFRIGCQQDWQPGTPSAAQEEAVTDKDGRFRLERLPPGSYTLSVLDGEAKGEWVALNRRIENLAAGREVACRDLVLTHGGTITGKITDRETGAPLPDTQITASFLEANTWRQGADIRTGPDGSYRLRLPAGKWGLQLGWREGYLSPWDEGTYEVPQVTVAQGQTVEGPGMTLLKAVEARVLVVDPEGKPDPKAVVSHLSSHGQAVQADGTAVLREVKPGSAVVVLARGSERSLQARVEITPQRDRKDPVKIQLKRCVPVTSRIVDDQGQPLKEIQVDAQHRLDMPGGSWTEAAMDTVLTDAQGRFTLWVLPGIEVKVAASAEGYGAAKISDLAPQAAQDVGALTLKKADSFVAGRVTDLDGKPVAGVQVYVWGEEQSPHESVTTDAQGRYRVEKLAAGQVQLSLQHPAYGYEYQDRVIVGSANVDLVMIPQEQASAPPMPAPGEAAPELRTVRWLNASAGGKRVPALKALRGKVVVLQFATPHNPAVERSTARLKQLLQQHGAGKLAVLAIYDASLPAAETARYVQGAGLPYPAGLVSESRRMGWDSPPFQAYGVRAVPTLVLIDRRGKVRTVDPSLDELEAEIGKLVEGR
jgi:protocatechuate 3,4-dioxygenase beta subunit